MSRYHLDPQRVTRLHRITGKAAINSHGRTRIPPDGTPRLNGINVKAKKSITRVDLPSEDIEILTEFDRNESKHDGSYSMVFDGPNLTIANKFRIDASGLLELDSVTLSGFKSTLEAIGISNSRAPVTIKGYVTRMSAALRERPIYHFTPESYAYLVEPVSIETNHAFASVLRSWHRLGYPGIDSKTIDVVNALKTKSSPSRKRITSDDPTEGWYTTQEYENLVDTYWLDYESGKVSLRDTSALLLTAQFGRRGGQLGALKVRDFASEGEADGVQGKRVAFPGAKDRKAELWFRGSKFEVHPMGDDLWDLCMLQVQSTILSHETYFQRPLTEAEKADLPFLEIHPKQLRRRRISVFKGDDSLHLSNASVTRILQRPEATRVISQRTGAPIREFAYRMRYTRARQLARLGVPRATLQYWLGHDGSFSLDHYYDDPAEDARLLNLEIQSILAPLSQAFFGQIRDKESDAIRGDQPSSRIELDGHVNVGTCGNHGFCDASVPIPCYRCSKFQPWVDAPHEEVLLRLLERQEQENNIFLPSKSRRILVPLQLDKDIDAVKLVIKLCDARKQELKADTYKAALTQTDKPTTDTNKNTTDGEPTE